MEIKNQNSMFSKRTSVQQDMSPVRGLKQTNSVYPLNKMRRLSFEVTRAKRNSSTNDLELAEALSEIDCHRKSKSAEAEQFILSNSEELSDEAALLPSEGIRCVKIEKKSFSSSSSSPRGTDKSAMDALRSELSKCKQELNDYNNATKELEQKYMKINVELGELQQTHERFIANRSVGNSDPSMDSCRDGSEFSLKRKCTHVFQRENEKSMSSNTFPKTQPATESNCASILRNKQKESTLEFLYCQQQQQKNQSNKPSNLSSKCRKFFEMPTKASSELFMDELNLKTHNLDGIYEAIMQAMGTQQDTGKEAKLSPKSAAAFGNEKNSFNFEKDNLNAVNLQKVIADLKDDEERYRSVIIEQQNCLRDFQTRCSKAKQIMQTQKNEIQKLTNCNQDLQNEVNKGIDQLRKKVDAKLRQVGPLTERLNEDRLRYQKVLKENTILREHKHLLQDQAKEMKIKLSELSKKRTLTLNRLKNVERDLRVFRNYNAALKQEKAKHLEESKKLKEKLDTLQETHKRMLARQRDVNDSHCRELQRRVYELEQRLGRSNNSTSNLLQERDRLITELQAQINTLVHNFEVSQKHIRMLRRHLHNAAGDVNIAATPNAKTIIPNPIIALKRKPSPKVPLK